MALISRRRFLASGALAAGSVAFGPGLLRDALAAPATDGPSPYGPLLAPDANDLMLPAGFTSRLIARHSLPVEGTAYPFPIFPDGQATFQTADGGWILVTNSESVAASGAGASAIRFSSTGAITDAYRILGGTNANCAGGPTPWGTWLSAEEYDRGLVWECDPAGVLGSAPRPALGVFNHEAAAVDPIAKRLYLTEDERDGGFYRFTPAAYPSLDGGLLEVAVVAEGSVTWRSVPDPTVVAPAQIPTRDQVPAMTQFDGGEGIWYSNGVLYFTTKGDKKVWAYEPGREQIEILFDGVATPSTLDAVDNVTVSVAGEIFVCEDGGNMEIGLISPERSVSAFLRFVGTDHDGSEVCGAAFDPSGKRLYLTSQRAFPAGPPAGEVPQPGGAVYEVSGPFRDGATSGVADPLPAGEQRPNGPLNPRRDSSGPRLGVRVVGRGRRAPLLARGLPVRVRSSKSARVALTLTTANLVQRPDPNGGTPRPRTIRLSRRSGVALRPRKVRLLRMRFGPKARARLLRRPRPLTARLTVTAVDPAGNRTTVVRTVRIRAGDAPAQES